MKTTLILLLLLLTGCHKEPAHGMIGVMPPTPAPPYVVSVGNPEMARFSNVITVARHTNDCFLIRWMEGDKTNEFHAWNVPVTVIYTKP